MKEAHTSVVRPHAVIFPFMAQGHVRPAMQLAERLHQVHGFKVTVVNSSWIHKRLGLHDATKAEDGLQFVDLQEGFPDDYYTTASIRTLFTSIPTLGPVLKKVLEKLNVKDPPITCVISDLNFLQAHKTASQLGLLSVGYVTQCVLAVSAKNFSPRLVEEGLLPLPAIPMDVRTETAVNTTEEENLLSQAVTCIPGLYPMRLRELHSCLLVRDLSDYMFQFFTYEQPQSLREREWTLVNTFYELEESVIEALQQDLGQKVTTVGPIMMTPKSREGTVGMDGEESSASSYWPEETECMDWLDKQKPVTVVYISFGSLMLMSMSALREFILGLEDSNVPFLFVIRPNLVDGPRAKEPESLLRDFTERTKDQGLIVSWAPQVMVLSHPAIAGFVTHCGWNSILESICMGVPMLGYPYFADQLMNNRYIVSVWKIGLEFEKQVDGSVKRTEVATKVRALAAGEGGVRTAALNWKEVARSAVERGGSSNNNMAAFVTDMNKRAQESAHLRSHQNATC